MNTGRTDNRSTRSMLPTILLAGLVGALFTGGCSGTQPTVSSSAPSQSAVVPVAPVTPATPAATPTGGVPSADTSSGALDGGGTDADIERYRTLSEGDPSNVQARVLLGFSYLQRVREKGDPTDYGRAQLVLDEALRLKPDDFDATVGKGVLALARHQFHDALKLGQQAVALQPTSPRGYGVLSDAQTELGMYDAAVASVQKMVDLRPDLSSYSRVSYARELHGEVEPAIAAMKTALGAGAGNVENTEYIRVLLGNLYFNKGDVSTAEKLYATALERSPGFVFALAGMGRVRGAQGRLSESIAEYQAAIDRIPLPEFVVAKGETEEAAGRSDDARKTYELVGAISQLLQANGVNTDLELALFNANHGTDPAAAVTLARAAYADQPNIKAADVLAWALYKAGQYDEAGRYADEALRLGTQDASMFYHAGKIALARGDKSRAKELLGRALATNPGFSPLYGPDAKAALESIGSE